LPPDPISSSLSTFSSRVHPYFVFLAIFLYFKRNLSFRAIADSLPIHISHVSIYKWVIKFGSLPFSFSSAFFLSADESVLLFKDRKYYIWFLVDWKTSKIVAWHFSRYRDYSNAIKLLKQIKQHPNTITTDGLPVYKQAIEELFGTGVHQRVRLGYNNAVESRYSLLKDFIRMKRGFKKFSNIPKYINGWVYIHNLFKDLRGDKNAIIQFLLSTITLS
jgi:transposase-like protein